MLVQQISQGAKHSWLGQISDDSRVQSIIEKGFWIDKITGNLIYTTMHGFSEIDYYGDLPRIVAIRHKQKLTVVIFKLQEPKNFES